MKITDTKVLDMIKRMRSCELEEAIDAYPENERDGRSDIQFFADEAGYILSLYEEDGTCHYDVLKESRYILNRTKYGKAIPVWLSTLKPVYQPSDIRLAKDVVNEYNRYKRLLKKLNSMGVYSRWI